MNIAHWRKHLSYYHLSVLPVRQEDTSVFWLRAFLLAIGPIGEMYGNRALARPTRVCHDVRCQEAGGARSIVGMISCRGPGGRRHVGTLGGQYAGVSWKENEKIIINNPILLEWKGRGGMSFDLCDPRWEWLACVNPATSLTPSFSGLGKECWVGGVGGGGEGGGVAYCSPCHVIACHVTDKKHCPQGFLWYLVLFLCNFFQRFRLYWGLFVTMGNET